jgi:hypothetical protein
VSAALQRLVGRGARRRLRGRQVERLPSALAGAHESADERSEGATRHKSGRDGGASAKKHVRFVAGPEREKAEQPSAHKTPDAGGFQGRHGPRPLEPTHVAAREVMDRAGRVDADDERISGEPLKPAGQLPRPVHVGEDQAHTHR